MKGSAVRIRASAQKKALLSPAFRRGFPLPGGTKRAAGLPTARPRVAFAATLRADEPGPAPVQAIPASAQVSGSAPAVILGELPCIARLPGRACRQCGRPEPAVLVAFSVVTRTPEDRPFDIGHVGGSAEPFSHAQAGGLREGPPAPPGARAKTMRSAFGLSVAHRRG
jgi:hypothetical protein